MLRILIILISILQLIGVIIYWLNIELDIKYRLDAGQTDYVFETGLRIGNATGIFCSILLIFSITLLLLGVFYKSKTK
jgi:hypothetical protein